MVICFTQTIPTVGDSLHLEPMPPRHWMIRPMGLKLGTYNIWGGHGFGLSQAIRDVEQDNYDLMILTDMKILDMVYCRNRLGH